MSQILVSAIITTHNRIELLKRAIDSVLNQTYKNIECIVIDDASDDGTCEYCESIDGIKYIRISKVDSRGGNYARNLGIIKSSGEYVAFLDDDDYWLPEKIEKQLALIVKSGCGLVYCGSINEYVNKYGVITTKPILPRCFSDKKMNRAILYNICCTTTNMFVKRDILVDSGMFDESLFFWQEYELCIRLAQLTNFDCLMEMLSIYRVNIYDKKRLTNKYFEWKLAVRYIKNKHADLYSKLSFKEYLKYKRMVVLDATNRCLVSKLYFRYSVCKLLSLFLRGMIFIIK